MNEKLRIAVPVLFAMAAAAETHAETVIAIKSGNWSDPDIWATRVWDEETQQDVYTPYGQVPTVDDTVIFNSGVEVNVDADFDINNFGYNQSNAEPAVLNLSGPDSMLYVYGENSDLYYNYKLVINMSDGAYFEAPKLNWGGGGYYRINVDASEFVANFNGQFQGSNLEGGEDSGVYFTNGALARSNNSDWKLGDGQGANYRLTVSFDGSELMMSGGNLNIASKGENAVTKFIAQNDSTIFTASPIEVLAENPNSYCEALFDNSSLTSGTFKVKTAGSNSAGANAVAILRNLKQDQVSLSGRIEVEGNAAGSTAEVRIVDSDITVKEGFTLRGSNGGLSLLTIDNSKVSFENAGQYLQAGSGGTSNCVIKNGSTVYGGSLNIQSSASVAASNMVTIFGKGSTYDSAALGSVHTANIGTYGGERLEGKYIGMVFGGFDNGRFFAADAGAYKCSWEFKAYEDSSFTFNLGASNALKASDHTQAILQARFLKPIGGQVYLDFSNVDVSGLEAGNYKFAILSSTESISDGGTWNFNANGEDVTYTFDWNKTLGWNEDTKQYANITESENVKLAFGEDGKCYEIESLDLDGAVDAEGNTKDDIHVLYVNVSVVPEPATWAAIFGAAALALAAFRRRRAQS